MTASPSPHPSIRVWVVDDDASIRWVLEKSLRREGMLPLTFEGSAELLDALEDGLPDVLVSDIRMPGVDGLALLDRVRTRWPTLPVIIMTAHSDLDAAVASYKGGAFEYLPKPFDLDAVASLVRRAAATRPALAPPPPAPPSPSTAMVGEAPAMQEVYRAIGRLSASNIAVLITGESGTGKELVARALHETSPRSTAPFIAVNTAAIPKDLLESEFFGHERGAFTGAATLRKGRFEQADGGTLFLDEIGDMPADLQTRLLRVLSTGEFYRVGGTSPLRVDVRVVAATHQNLEQLVKEGKFREDLFHRIHVIRIRIPALRERKEDIPLLMQHFLQRAGEELKVPAKRMTPSVQGLLSQFAWPGNVRQLENICRWLTVMAPGQEIHIEDLPPELREAGSKDAAPTLGERSAETPEIAPAIPANPPPAIAAPSVVASAGAAPSVAAAPLDDLRDAQGTWTDLLRTWAEGQLLAGRDGILDEATRDLERVLLLAALQASHGQRMEAAKRLGWGRNTLTRKFKELGLGDDEDAEGEKAGS